MRLTLSASPPSSGALRDLAAIFRRTLHRIRGIADGFHMVLHTSPNTLHRSETLGFWKSIEDDYHWHIEILPILGSKAKSYAFKEVYSSPLTPERRGRAAAGSYRRVLRRCQSAALRPTPLRPASCISTTLLDSGTRWRDPFSPATEFIFDVTPDRKTVFAVSVFLGPSAIQAWSVARGRDLSQPECYAAVKLRLMQGFDDIADMLQSGRRLRVEASEICDLLDSIGID